MVPRFKHQVDAAFTFEHSVLPVLWAAFSLLKCPAQRLLVIRNKGDAFTGQSGQVDFTQSGVAENPVVCKAGIRKQPEKTSKQTVPVAIAISHS